MTPIAWNILLLVLKWAFIGLIFTALFVILVSVRREMGMRISPGASPAIAPGRLETLNAGSDPRLRPGDQLPLQPETTMGASPGNDLVIKDQFVSGYHARLRWDGISWWVEDLESTNGTFVDESRVTPHEQVHLPVGAILRLGDMAFRLLE